MTCVPIDKLNKLIDPFFQCLFRLLYKGTNDTLDKSWIFIQLNLKQNFIPIAISAEKKLIKRSKIRTSFYKRLSEFAFIIVNMFHPYASVIYNKHTNSIFNYTAMK